MSDYSERQLEIIHAAISIIAEKGIQKLTIKNLSASVGISEPAIYRHFKSKVEILEALLENLRKESKYHISTVLKSNEGAVEKIDEILMLHLNNFAECPALAAVVFSEGIFRDNKLLSDKVLHIMEQSQEAFLKIITNGIDNGAIRNDILPEHIVIFTLGALRFLVNKWYLSGHEFNLTEEGEKLRGSLKILLSKKK